MKLYCSSCKKIFSVGDSAGEKETGCPQCGNKVALPDSNVAPGVVLGDFLIEKVISSGGMGVVYLAKQLSLDRNVALKVLQSKHIDDKEYVESLYREARAAAKISHPNVVQAYAVGEDDGVFYFAMEYIRGDTFKVILKNRGGKLEFKEAAKVIRDIAGALSAAWREQKLVHQDIKPDNIMLDANGFAKLADLGLARSASAQDDADDADEVLGTPQYISPEQLTGVPTDIRSDIYSLGATFYQFVTGRYAYVADSLDQLPQLHVEGNLEPPKDVNPDLPDALNSIIMKMMARKLENRYQSPDELISDLDKYLANADKPTAPRLSGAVPKMKLGSVAQAPKANAAPASAQKNAKPLSLNLNGAAPKPAATPVVPKPAAKPAVPQAAPKTATPPVAPKPATPPAAKPVAKPAAAPAAPKPATPPAAPNSGDTPVVKPAAPPEVKPAENKVEVKKVEPQPVPDKKEPAKAKKKPEIDTSKLQAIFGASFKWILLGITAVIILAIAFVTTVMILNSKGKLPVFLDPVAKYLNLKADAAKNKALELAKPQAVTVDEKKPEGPVTRPEYLKMIEDILNFRLLNPQENSKFLAMADQAYPEVLKAVTQEEKIAMERFFKIYSPADEKSRIVSARNVLRNQFLKQVDAVISAREKAEQERLAAIEKQKKQAEEAAKRAAEIDKRNKEEQQRQIAYLAQLKKDCLLQGEKLAAAMLEAAITDDRSKLEMALLDVDDFSRSVLVQSAEEKKVFGQFSGFVKNLNKELQNLQRYKRQLGRIKLRNNITITMPNRKSALVEKIQPGEILCRTANDLTVSIKFHTLPAKSRERFVKTINLNLKSWNLNNPAFFIGVFDQHVDDFALKNMPSKGFWKDYWTFFEKHLKK